MKTNERNNYNIKKHTKNKRNKQSENFFYKKNTKYARSIYPSAGKQYST